MGPVTCRGRFVLRVAGCAGGAPQRPAPFPLRAVPGMGAGGGKFGPPVLGPGMFLFYFLFLFIFNAGKSFREETSRGFSPYCHANALMLFRFPGLS